MIGIGDGYIEYKATDLVSYIMQLCIFLFHNHVEYIVKSTINL